MHAGPKLSQLICNPGSAFSIQKLSQNHQHHQLNLTPQIVGCDQTGHLFGGNGNCDCLLLAGPGCSSLGIGAFTELGPFRVHSGGKTLYENRFAWNKGMNIHHSLFSLLPSTKRSWVLCFSGTDD